MGPIFAPIVEAGDNRLGDRLRQLHIVHRFLDWLCPHASRVRELEALLASETRQVLVLIELKRQHEEILEHIRKITAAVGERD